MYATTNFNNVKTIKQANAVNFVSFVSLQRFCFYCLGSYFVVVQINIKMYFLLWFNTCQMTRQFCIIFRSHYLHKNTTENGVGIIGRCQYCHFEI